MKKTFFVLPLLIVCIGIGTAMPVYAQTTNYTVLLRQMQELLLQLSVLQAQLGHLDEAREVSSIQTHKLSPSRFYSGSYEAIYFVEDTQLIPYSNTVSSQNDQVLWELFKDVIGSSATRSYITEFRIYNDTRAEFDAFVDQVGKNNTWIVGINTANVGVESALERESAVELFVHEYAHILYHYQQSIHTEFEQKFWDQRSYRRDDFVTKYAMTDSEEDFSESFAFYVLREVLPKSTVAKRKVLFFDEYDVFSDIKREINNRLNN